MLSIWKNEGKENDVIDEIAEFTIRHFRLINEILKIPSYIWEEPDERPKSKLREIITDEEQLFKSNPIITILIFLSIITAIVFIFYRFK